MLATFISLAGEEHLSAGSNVIALSRTLKPMGVRHRTGAGVFCTHMPAAPPGRILKAPYAMTDGCFLTKCTFHESSLAPAFYRLKLECAGVHERSGPLGKVRLESGQQREERQRSCCLFLLQLFFWASKRKVKKFLLATFISLVGEEHLSAAGMTNEGEDIN